MKTAKMTNEQWQAMSETEREMYAIRFNAEVAAQNKFSHSSIFTKFLVLVGLKSIYSL